MLGTATAANMLATVFHIALRETAHAARKSVCVRPCRTPFMRTCWTDGVQAADLFEGLEPVILRLEYENSRCVVLTSKGRNV